jgi:RNA polymerase sigma factor (sigma-70 family)
MIGTVKHYRPQLLTLPLMTINWDNFELLLAWLDPDRERAAVKYEEIRNGLVNVFNWRGCYDAEDLADETIGRVINKVPEIAPNYKGDPALYFYGVAKHLLFEVGRRAQSKAENVSPEQLQDTAVPEQLRAAAAADNAGDHGDAGYECLEQCLLTLPEADRELILNYYQQEKHTIEFRRQLAQRHGLTANNLRVKVYRIRATLHDCIQSCLANKAGSETNSLQNHD